MAKVVFQVRSKSGKRIRLTKGIWYDKILIEHPEFKEKGTYLEDVKRVIEDPDYIIILSKDGQGSSWP